MFAKGTYTASDRCFNVSTLMHTSLLEIKKIQNWEMNRIKNYLFFSEFSRKQFLYANAQCSCFFSLIKLWPLLSADVTDVWGIYRTNVFVYTWVHACKSSRFSQFLPCHFGDFRKEDVTWNTLSVDWRSWVKRALELALDSVSLAGQIRGKNTTAWSPLFKSSTKKKSKTKTMQRKIGRDNLNEPTKSFLCFGVLLYSW